jgi:hypothetical protein
MRESSSTYLHAPPHIVFGQVTDIARLPEWNRAITEVLEQPEQLAPGAIWTVRLHALGQSWVSKSTVTELDATSGTFRHRSRTDDGNPSYADWEWTARPDGSGTCLSVRVDLHPKSFWRKYLLVQIRRPALRREMRASLTALSHQLAEKT